ncbi:hypothetical protein TUM20985_47650 [Mycobacterium antarcticum]|nr:hypothetical protein TUM20985_47650 [Mycolicibacterium sp. TUM20985]GLP77420.1 hypothetical protein TUM20983_45300 [Mycolicibacterium sp. TUM20983]
MTKSGAWHVSTPSSTVNGQKPRFVESCHSAFETVALALTTGLDSLAQLTSASAAADAAKANRIPMLKL